MHHSVIEFAARQFLRHGLTSASRVVDVGSYDLNGSVRPLVLAAGASYFGIDFRPCDHARCVRPCVDLVADGTDSAAVSGLEGCDWVVCTEVLEHVREWHLLIDNLKRLAAPSGRILLTTRGAGFPCHEFPADHWRFTRDVLAAAFDDCLDVEIEDDPEYPGVFLTARAGEWQPLSRSLEAVPSPPPPSPLLSVVVACHGPAPDLPVMLGCLRNQREYYPGTCGLTGGEVWRFAAGPCATPIEIILCSDGPYAGPPLNPIADPSLRLVECEPVGVFGHATRAPGIAAAKAEWIVLTNCDNYFVSGWLHLLSQELRDDVGIVYWDCLSSLWRWGTQGGCSMELGRIDLSCAAVRRDIAKSVGFPWRHYQADWDYLSACAGKAAEAALRIVHIDEILCVHN